MTKTKSLLNVYLATNVAFKVKVQNYHWNVTGVLFNPLHDFFQDIYEELEETTDEIGEQLRILKSYANGGLETFHLNSEIEDETELVSAKDMLVNVSVDNKIVISILENLAEAANEENLLDVEDFAIEKLRDHKMLEYKLDSHIIK